MNDIFQECRALEEIARFSTPAELRFAPSRRGEATKKLIFDQLANLRYEIQISGSIDPATGDYTPHVLFCFDLIEAIEEKIREL